MATKTKASVKTNKSLSVKSTNALNNKNKQVQNTDEYVFLEKVIDKNGTSIINVDYFDEENYHLISSRYGATPLISYGKTYINKPIDKIIVIKKFNKSLFDNAADNAIILSNLKASNASDEYNSEIEKATLIKKKNLMIAKIDSLRILNKAITLQKLYHETANENQRYKESIAEIKKLHKSLLEKNDLELQHSLAQLEQNETRDLNNLVAKRNNKYKKIDRDYEVILAKRNFEHDKIQTLARGEEFNKQLYNEKITNIKKRYATVETDKNLLEPTIDNVADALSQINYYKLSPQERDIVDKFFNALEKDNQFEERTRTIEKYHNEIVKKQESINNIKQNINNLNNRKAYIVDTEQYHKIISAKKNSLIISLDATKFAADYKTLYQTYLEIDEKNNKRTNKNSESTALVTTKKSAKKSSSNTKKQKAEKAANKKETNKKQNVKVNKNQKLEEDQIRKWRKIEQEIANSDGYNIIKLDDDKYQIEYTKNDKKENKKAQKAATKAKKQQRSKEIEEIDEQYKVQQAEAKKYRDAYYFNQKEQIKQNKEFLKQSKANKKALQQQTSTQEKADKKSVSNAPKQRYLSTTRIKKLKDDMMYIMNSQTTIENIDTFIENGIDLDAVWNELNSIDNDKFLNCKENKEFIKEYVLAAIKIYKDLENEEYKKDQRIMQSQRLNQKFNIDVERTEAAISRRAAKNETDYYNKEAKIKNKYVSANDQIQNQYFINKESIIEHEIATLNKEEENHLQNLAWFKSNIDKYRKINYEFENSEIKRITKEILAYNKKNPNDQISLDNIPTMINPEVLSKNYIRINLSTLNNKVVASSNVDKINIKVLALNKKLPTDVKKIYVLDKFKNVKDVDTRAALLKELSAVNYANDLKYIDLIEQKQIELAKNELKHKLSKVEKIRAEAEFIRRQSLIIGSDSTKMTMIANDELRLKNRNWLITDHENKLMQRQMEREFKLQEKINKLENK